MGAAGDLEDAVIGRRAARIDDNQTAVVEALRKVGAVVQSLGAVGNGCPDLLIFYAGYLYLMEVKDGAKRPSARALTPDQVKWHADWSGAPISVVTSPADAILALGITC